MKLLMLKGLPASGKSTFAKTLVAEGWKRVNKDSLREMIDDGKWSKTNENQIVAAEKGLAEQFLEGGYNVIVDDTNFAWEDSWKEFANSMGAEFEVKYFDTPLKECLARDAKRGEKSVGEKIICDMYFRYIKPNAYQIEFDVKLPSCFIFDIDGTLSKMKGRSPYEWDKVDTDEPNLPIASLCRILWQKDDAKIILVSGRDAICMEKTQKWLLDNGIPYDQMFMRPVDDNRKDVEIKKEIYEVHIKNRYNVLSVFDDRDQVVDLWRSLGLTCLQVDEGNF